MGTRMSGARTTIPATAIIALTIATTVTGCGGEPAGIAQSPPAGSATAGSAGVTPSASESVPPPRTMRFSAKTYACTPKADPQLRGAWVTDAPRYRVKPGQSVALGLRDRHKGPTGHVIASVYTRHGGHAYARTMLRQDKWAVVHFPRDFINARTHKHINGYPKGVYTVVWVTGKAHHFISCDGFATIGAGHHRHKHRHGSGHRSSGKS